MRKTPFIIGEYYHIFNRGVDKRITFVDEEDVQRFYDSIEEFNVLEPIGSIYENSFVKKPGSRTSKSEEDTTLVSLIAHCANPNHFHLLLTPLVDGGISKFILKLQTGYSMYFNKKNERVGALFQGVFKSQHINENKYLYYIYAYIHLNPAKLKNSNWKTQPKSFLIQLKKFIAEYPYSSLQEYISLNYRIINPKPFPINKRDIYDYNTIVDDFSEENKE